MKNRAERQVRVWALAQACANLGARARTINLLTGMQLPEIHRLFFSDLANKPRGRAPDSPEWYHGANLLDRTQASIFGSIYMRLRSAGITGEDALVCAYKYYQRVCRAPYRISFDRAFDLAAHTDTSKTHWSSNVTAFTVVTCRRCTSEYLASFGVQDKSSPDCPFCRLLQRYETDPRLHKSFPKTSVCGCQQ